MVLSALVLSLVTWYLFYGSNRFDCYGSQRGYRILADRHNLGKVDLESARSTTTDEAPLMKAARVRLPLLLILSIAFSATTWRPDLSKYGKSARA